jgi:shikimate kinase
MSNIYIIGPMGSGKTTIGTRLAEKMGLDFYDTDHEIESHTGASVNLIFDIEGEAGFRKREKNILLELATKQGVLIATGGGIIVAKSNRDVLRRSGLVIYLQTTVEQQLQRLRRDRTRPILQTTNKADKLYQLATIRDPLYAETADLTFPVKNRNINSTVNQIYQAIIKHRQLANKHDTNNSGAES